MIGMRSGSRRILTIPASKAYGPEGLDSLVPPNATVQIGMFFVFSPQYAVWLKIKTLSRMYVDWDSASQYLILLKLLPSVFEVDASFHNKVTTKALRPLFQYSDKNTCRPYFNCSRVLLTTYHHLRYIVCSHRRWIWQVDSPYSKVPDLNLPLTLLSRIPSRSSVLSIHFSRRTNHHLPSKNV